MTPQELYDELVALDSKITIEDVGAFVVHGPNFGGHEKMPKSLVIVRACYR